jgi:hypothetical protein
MQKAYDSVVSPASIAKTILDELECFDPFNLLKHSWYLAGISVLLFICFLVLSVCHMVERQFLGLRVGLHWENFKKRRGELWTAEFEKLTRT